MKRKLLFCFTAIALLAIACQNGSDKQASADTTQPAEKAAPAKPANVLAIWHKIKDYNKWLPGYMGHDTARIAAGLHDYVIARDADDTSMVLVALHMDDTAKARAFINSPGLKEAMKKGGVTGVPVISLLDVQSADTATIAVTMRLGVTHKVKDYDAWKKSFDDHKKVRMDAGLIDRTISRNFDDPNTVTVVFAVTDEKKARDFSKSKELKEKMDAAGVVGPPTIHFYNITKKF